MQAGSRAHLRWWLLVMLSLSCGAPLSPALPTLEPPEATEPMSVDPRPVEAVRRPRPLATRPPDHLCFPSGRCLTGRIRAFWEQNDGQHLLGAPLSEPFEREDPQTGEALLAQWFERARVEVHPRFAGTPYEVSLGLLGVETYQGRHGGAPLFRPEVRNPECDWSPPSAGGSGINVCGPFREYARRIQVVGFADPAAASLYVLGLPLGPPTREWTRVGRRESVRTVQWFERARLELDEAGRAVPAPLGRELVESTPGTPEPMPDYWLALDEPRVEEKTFAANAPELDPQEACILTSGKRRLLRFAAIIKNVGGADLQLGNPANDPRFIFSTAHGHYHLKGFADYRLLDASGAPAATGHKQAFAVWDVFPKGGHYTDKNQGLSVGFADVYREVACQWVDITGLPAGNYTLQVEVNPGGAALPETQFENNLASMDVELDAAGQLVRWRTR